MLKLYCNESDHITACQFKIDDKPGLDCMSCTENGALQCDPSGCPMSTFFVETEKRCVCKFIGPYIFRNYSAVIVDKKIYILN